MDDPTAHARIVRTTPGSALGSSLSLGKGTSKLSILPKQFELFLQRRKSSSSSHATDFGTTKLNLPPINPAQKAFDAIINYVLDRVTEKQILKQTILITSITRPFLSSTSPSRKLGKENDQSKRASFVPQSSYSLSSMSRYESGESLRRNSSSSTVISSASTKTPSLAHMIHILPHPNRPNLIRCLDSFLSSFSISNVSDNSDHAKQYIMYGRTLCDTARHIQDKELERLTVADLIFHGSLDNIRGKAWIGSSEDILLPSQIPGSSMPAARGNAGGSGERSNSQHPYPSPARARVRSSATLPLTDALDNQKGKTAANLLQPPLPRYGSSNRDRRSQPPPNNPAPAFLKPSRPISQPLPLCDAACMHGNTHVAQVSASLTISPSRSPQSSSRSSVVLMVPPQAPPPALSASAAPTLEVFVPNRRKSTKSLKRSKLNMMVESRKDEPVMEDGMEKKTYTQAGSDGEGGIEKKTSINFWKIGRDAMTR
jgi:hypothetical protein